MAWTVRTALALALTAVTALPAFADEARGKITSIDPDALVLVLDGDRSFDLPEDFYVEDLEPGMSVVIQYDVVDDTNVVSDLEISE